MEAEWDDCPIIRGKGTKLLLSDYSTLTSLFLEGLLPSFLVLKCEGPVPIPGTGPFGYQLGTKKRNAKEVMMK